MGWVDIISPDCPFGDEQSLDPRTSLSDKRVAKDVLAVLSDSEEMTFSEIVSAVDRPREDVKRDLRKMARNADITITSSWKYKVATKHRGDS